MAVPNNYIDKIKKDGDSRMISPAADMVRVDNDNFEGTDLDEVLDEVAQAIGEAGEGGYAPPAGGIPKTDLAQSVQDSLDKADSALQDEDVAEVAKTGDYDDLQNKPTIPDTSNLATKTELAAKQDILVAGTGIVIGNDGKTVSVAESIRTGAGKGATAVQSVSVESEEDGTVDIHVDDDKYTINLNHTHEGMAKLAKFVASNPPASMANDTIYAQVDNLTTPTEIQSLWLFGCEFAGGIPDTGEPMISSPSNGSTINLGDNTAGQGVSKTITVKGKHLTGDLTVAVGTGLTISYGQSTGQSSVTVPMAQALLGAQVTIAYSGSGALADGSLVISHSNDVLSSVVVVVVVEYFPAGYTKLSSISGITDFITTNINAQGTTWEFDVVAGQQTTVSEILAKYDNGESGTALKAGKFAAGMITGYWGLGSTYATSVPKTTRSTIVLAFTSSQASMTIGNDTVTRPTADTTNATLYLFGAPEPNGSNYKIRGTIYSVKCVSGASFNGVPAKRTSDNKEGIYDLANDVFYPLK